MNNSFQQEIVESKFFTKLIQPSTIATSLLSCAKEAPPDEWVDCYGFKALPLKKEQFLCDPLLKQIHDLHVFTASVLTVPPNYVYDWHVDTNHRGVTINMLLTPEVHSHCLFRLYGFVFDLPYAKDTYYLFNNQIEHMVINFEKQRYIFSVEFDENKTKLSYQKLAKELMDLLEKQ
jgi:hypothetical protein